MSVMSIKGLPTISTVTAGAACSAKVQEILSVLRRTGLDATDEVYGLLAALTARFASMVGDPRPENNMWTPSAAYAPEVKVEPQTYATEAPAGLDDVFSEVIDKSETPPVNDITVQNEFVLGLLALHLRMTGKALKEQGVSKETLARLQGMGLIESTGKGRAAGWRLVATDHNMPGDLAPHDSHVAAYNAHKPTAKPVDSVKPAAPEKVKPAPKVKPASEPVPDARTLENWTVADLLAELNARAAGVNSVGHKKRITVALNTLKELLAK